MRSKESAAEPLEFVIWLSAKRRRFVEGDVHEIARPDFSDLESGLRWILSHYGWGKTDDMAVYEQVDLSLRLLETWPALLIVDDVDSLEGSAEAALEFFTLEVPKTRSKVLFTSRRKLMGLGATTTIIEGFNQQDGLPFIRSRVVLHGLDPKIFTASICRDILRVTDGSPLFIEDLLRLTSTGLPVADALREWQDRGGDDARAYALGREYSLLSDSGKKALVASAISDGPVSLAEIQGATAMSDETARSAIEELQRLFLVPKPKLIEAVERFDLNANTRALVRAFAEKTDLFRRIDGAFRAMSGDSLKSPGRRVAVGAYVRQSIGLVKQKKHSQAEKTLEAGLKEYPNDLDLLAQRAWLYKNWEPKARLAEARDLFLQCKLLHCENEGTYLHWSDMEAREQEWTKSAQAAEEGLSYSPNSPLLRFRAGYARSRLGMDLMSELQPRAADELLAARAHLQTAIKLLDTVEDHQSNKFGLRSNSFRELVLTLEALVDFFGSRERQHAGRHRGFAREGLSVLQDWQSCHVEDLSSIDETARLEPKFRSQMA